MKYRKVEAGVTYIGVVEDNLDPNKEGRLKVRVVDVYDEAKTEDLPWASPWKDLGGGQISIPEKGKVVIVVFEQGDAYKPEYIFTEHWNVNLEKKLKGLSDADYLSMKSVIFDHNTQIYTNDSEGLKLDHKFNNVNIKSNGININLKDNSGLVNIGDSTANQQSILGNHFLNWFDEFVDALLNNTAFLGNAGAPILANPALIRTLVKYKSQKDPIFLSHHVNIVDNNKVSTVRLDNREETPQHGDNWQSTRSQNTLTTTTDETNKPTDGEKPKYNENHIEPSTEKPGIEPTATPVPKPVEALPEKSSQSYNKKVEKIIWFLKNKNYQIYEKEFHLNMVAFRNKYQTKDSDLPNITNVFDEELCVFYKNESGNWELFEYSITTVPGYEAGKTTLPTNVAILVLGQYIERLSMINYQGDEKYQALSFNECSIHRNDKIDRYNFESPIEVGNFAITIHRSSDISSSENVFNYSEGAQVFKNFNQYEQFIKICKNQIEKGSKSTFTYTLCSKKEFDEYASPDEQRELTKTLPNPVSENLTSITATTSTATQSIGPETEFKSDIEKLIKRRFGSEIGKPSLKSYLDRFTKDKTNSFETRKTVTFAEGLTRQNIDSLLSSLNGVPKSEIGDSVSKYFITKRVLPKLKSELQRHIHYLVKKGKLKKDDYFYKFDEDISKGYTKSNVEKGIFIWRASFKERDTKPKDQYILNNLVSAQNFPSIKAGYVNLLDSNNKLQPDRPSPPKKWVIEPVGSGQEPLIIVEIIFMPFTK